MWNYFKVFHLCGYPGRGTFKEGEEGSTIDELPLVTELKWYLIKVDQNMKHISF